ncbi:MAG TPA: hypothetical protein VJK25_03290 [Patescibacteria group bacterium]|nr:hypothetical protein [Patescibacteria group bacterium]
MRFGIDWYGGQPLWFKLAVPAVLAMFIGILATAVAEANGWIE